MPTTALTRPGPAQPHQVEAVALFVFHVLEAVLAEPELGLFPVVFRERGEVPGVDFVVPDVDRSTPLPLSSPLPDVESARREPRA